MDKLKYIKLENPDGSYSESIPLSANSDYIDINGNSLTDILGEINVETDGSIGNQLEQLEQNKINISDIVNNLSSDNISVPLSAKQGKILNTKIEDEKKVLKFHAVADSQATYIIEFANGKKMLVDTGMPDSFESSKEAIDRLGITKFDYFMITHMHYDHESNVQRFLDNYDFNNCVCWVGMKPDYINHGDIIIDNESTYNNVINLLQAGGLNPIVPINNSYYVIDEDTKLHFLNTDPIIAENYYSANIIPEYQTERHGVNFNQFSLITEIMYKKDVITLTGDIEKINEQYYYPYMHKTSLMILPHHGINRDYYNQFYYATMPEFAYASWIAESSSWLRKDNKEFHFVKELGVKMLSSYNSIPVNGLHTFISNGYSLKNLSLSSGTNNPSIENGRSYSDFVQVIDYTVKFPNETTIDDIFNNMNEGDYLLTNWLTDFATDYEAIYNQLVAIFPDFDNITEKLNLEFRKTRNNVREIKIYNNRVSYMAQGRGSNTPISLISGNGILNESITGIDNLIDRLKQLPFGHYTLKNYKDDIGNVLLTTGNYILDINIIEKWIANNDTVVVAFITGSFRSTTQPSNTTDARAIIGYINTSNSPKYIWYKVN